MRGAFALAFALGCGASAPSPTEPAPVASPVASAVASAAPTEPATVDAGAFGAGGTMRVVRESIHPTAKANPFIARLGGREVRAAKLVPIDPKVGALADAAADSICYVATGLSTDMDATCTAKIDSVAGSAAGGPAETPSADATTFAASVDVGFEDDTMQSRAKTRATMSGTVTLDASHAIVRATFRGRETFAERSPCEKIDVCEKCDPLVRSASCPAQCYCPFRPAGTADVETSYAR